MSEIKDLSIILFKLNSADEIDSILNEIMTPNEIRDISLRWQLLQKLKKGETQRHIASDLGISLCKITRGSKILKNKNSISYKVLDKK